MDPVVFHVPLYILKKRVSKVPLPLLLILLSGSILCLSSCKKDRDQLPFEEIRIGTGHDLKGIHKDQSGRLFVSGGDDSRGVIYYSSDSGRTWKLRTQTFDKSINDIWIESDDSGFSIDKDVLIYSTKNAGSSWSQYFPDSWPLSVNRNLRDIIRSDSSTMVICGGKDFGNGLIYVSHDNGDTWEYSEYTHELRGVSLKPGGHGLAVGYGAVLMTVNNGDDWTIIDSPSEYFTGITGGMNGQYFLCGFNGGLYITLDDGSSFRNLKKNNKLFSSRDRFTCISARNNIIIACGENGLAGVSSDNGDSWNFYESFNNGDVNDVVIITSQLAVAAGDDGKIYRLRI